MTRPARSSRCCAAPSCQVSRHAERLGERRVVELASVVGCFGMVARVPDVAHALSEAGSGQERLPRGPM